MLRGRDYHIHTGHIGCGGNTATVGQIYRRCEELGRTSIAITDHLNRIDQVDQHKAIRADMEANTTHMEVFFGTELDVPPHNAPLPYNKIIKENIGFQFAIGGVHGTHLETYDLSKLIDLQHQGLCKTAAEPLIDVVVHPWWFSKHEFDQRGFPWFDDLSVVPQDIHLEFIRTAVANETAIEINAGAIYCNPAFSDRFKEQYSDYIRLMLSEGAKLSVCSDAHSLAQLERTQVVEDILEDIGVPDDSLWHPTQARSMRILEW